MTTADSFLPHVPAGHLVKAARDALLYSQEQLAKASGVSVSTVARIERGSIVSAESLKSVCAVLGLDAVTLRGATPTRGHDAGPAAPADSPPTGNASEATATPSQRWSDLPRLILRDSLVIGASFLLCLLAIEIALQATAVTFADRRAGHEETLLGTALLASAAEVNRSAATYSSALPADHPDRSWTPWSRYKPWIWHACGPESLLRRALMGEGETDGSQCIERSLPQRLSRRDADRTEFVVGPIARSELVTYAGLLTGDPTIAIGAFASPIGDLPPPEATWADPRSGTWSPDPSMGKRLFLHLRISKASR